MVCKLFIISASVGLLVGSLIAFNYFKKESDDGEDQNRNKSQLSHHPKNEEVSTKLNDYAVTLNPVAEKEISKVQVEINEIQEIHQDETRAPPQVDELKEVPQVKLMELPQLYSNGTVKLEKFTLDNEGTIDNSTCKSEEFKVKKEEDVVEPNTSNQGSGDGNNLDEATATTKEMTEVSDESMAKLQQLKDIHLAIKSVSKGINHPNGIINYGNSCFVNGVLQSLDSCDQFVKLFELIGDWEEVLEYPVINMFKCFFITYFKERAVIKPGMIKPLMENYCLHISGLNIHSIDQQDSHAFMEYALSILDSEFEQLMGQLEKSAAPTSTTPPPQESSSSSKPPVKVSPIKQMFYGSLRSHIFTEDKFKTSSQEFSSLQVSIQHDAINSVKDALNYYTMPDEIEYINEKDKSRTMALQYAEFESLPNMLVIQLLRFEYLSGTPTKITKKIEISEKLELSVFEDKNDENSKLIIKEYSLVSVVNHRGSGVGFGHYFCYSLFNNIWYLCDDIFVFGPTTSRAFNRNHEPYLLLYKFDRIIKD